MAFTANAVSKTRTYHYENAEITFDSSSGGLFVTIRTAELYIRSVEATDDDCNRCAALFGDKKVMEKFVNGETRTPDKVRERIEKVWAERWSKGIPFSGFLAFKIDDTKNLLGFVALSHWDKGQLEETEISYLFHSQYWGMSCGGKTVTAVMKYLLAIMKEGYTFSKVVATARPDNPASVEILRRKIGMRFDGLGEKYGAVRFYYSIDISQLEEKSTQKTADSRRLIPSNNPIIHARFNEDFLRFKWYVNLLRKRHTTGLI